MHVYNAYDGTINVTVWIFINSTQLVMAETLAQSSTGVYNIRNAYTWWRGMFFLFLSRARVRICVWNHIYCNPSRFSESPLVRTIHKCCVSTHMTRMRRVWDYLIFSSTTLLHRILCLDCRVSLAASTWDAFTSSMLQPWFSLFLSLSHTHTHTHTHKHPTQSQMWLRGDTPSPDRASALHTRQKTDLWGAVL